MDYLSKKTCSYFGYAGSVLFFVSWGLAIFLDGSWTFGTNTLSDLGISDNLGSVIMFNLFSCIGCSILWMTEVIGIINSETGVGRIYGILTACAMVTLFCIGVFNKGMGTIHLVFAWSYLGLVVSSMVFACFSRFFRRKVTIAVTAVMILLCPVVFMVLPFPGFEATASALAVVWSAMLAWAYGTSDDVAQ